MPPKETNLGNINCMHIDQDLKAKVSIKKGLKQSMELTTTDQIELSENTRWGSILRVQS